MRIMGIDPGVAVTGYGIIDVEEDSLFAVVFGCIRTSQEKARSVRLCEIYEEMIRIIEVNKPDFIAIEQLFFNKNTKTALQVGEARGVALLAAGKCGIDTGEYTPLQVKECLAGFGRAKKEQVKEIVRIELDLEDEEIPIDASDALAIAICHYYLSQMDR